MLLWTELGFTSKLLLSRRYVKHACMLRQFSVPVRLSVCHTKCATADKHIERLWLYGSLIPLAISGATFYAQEHFSRSVVWKSRTSQTCKVMLPSGEWVYNAQFNLSYGKKNDFFAQISKLLTQLGWQIKWYDRRAIRYDRRAIAVSAESFTMIAVKPFPRNARTNTPTKTLPRRTRRAFSLRQLRFLLQMTLCCTSLRTSCDCRSSTTTVTRPASSSIKWFLVTY